VYDDGNAAMAARLWWMLRWVGHDQVSVLDGGIAAWNAAGLPLEQGSCVRGRGDLPLGAVHDNWVVSAEELQHLLREQAVLLVDARSADRFRGLVEPIDSVAGHIPGAVNLPYEHLLDPGSRFLDPRQLRDRIGKVLADHEPGDVVAMCGSGVTACHLLLGMEIAGLSMARLYPGSWSEWIRDSNRPVATRAGI
jgi:thiosulfate/3-mercaptopyruvate sulfurtransferase